MSGSEWYKPVILALGRLRQEGSEFQDRCNIATTLLPKDQETLDIAEEGTGGM